MNYIIIKKSKSSGVLHSSENQKVVTDPSITADTIVITALNLHQPGIEPGSVPWQGTILPLDHWCFFIRILHKIIFIK